MRADEAGATRHEREIGHSMIVTSASRAAALPDTP
jgi:hypothetical protein